VTKLKILAGSLALITSILLVSTRSSWAGEPRPWLCRDKPVFSDSHPMQYEVSAKRGAWQIFFMQFQINAAHDGFSIQESRELTSMRRVGRGSAATARIHHALRATSKTCATVPKMTPAVRQPYR
jgi:hypothetical protein